MVAVVLFDGRMTLQSAGGSLAPELRVRMLPMPTQKAMARPVPRPARAPWKRQENKNVHGIGGMINDFNCHDSGFQHRGWFSPQ